MEPVVVPGGSEMIKIDLLEVRRQRSLCSFHIFPSLLSRHHTASRYTTFTLRLMNTSSFRSFLFYCGGSTNSNVMTAILISTQYQNISNVQTNRWKSGLPAGRAENPNQTHAEGHTIAPTQILETLQRSRDHTATV